MSRNRDYATENINLIQQVINLKVANKDKAETIKAMKQELLEYSQLRDRFKVLYEENQELKTENEKLLVNKNFAQAVALKYKKAIEILKNYIEYCTFGAEYDFDTYVTSQCTNEEQDLLKEVLECYQV